MEIFERIIMGAAIVGSLCGMLFYGVRESHFWVSRQRWLDAEELIKGTGVSSDEAAKYFKYVDVIKEFLGYTTFAVFVQCLAMGWIGNLVEDLYNLPHYELHEFVWVAIDTLFKGLFLDFMETFQISVINVGMQDVFYYQVVIFLFRSLYSLMFAVFLLSAYNCWRVRRKISEQSGKDR